MDISTNLRCACTLTALVTCTQLPAQDDTTTIGLSKILGPDHKVEFYLAGAPEIGFSNSGKVGGVTGSENEEIFSGYTISIPGWLGGGSITIPSIHADTRIGTVLDTTTEFANTFDFSFNVTPSALDPLSSNITTQLKFSSGREKTGFRVLEGSLSVTSVTDKDWALPPTIKNSMKFTGLTRMQSKQEVRLLGVGFEKEFDTGDLNWDFDLWNLDTSLDPVEFSSPIMDGIPEFGAVTETSVAGDYVIRKTWGPRVPGSDPKDKNPERISQFTADILSPIRHLNDSVSHKGKTTSHDIDFDAVRFGADVSKLLGNISLFLEGRIPLGNTYSLKFNLISVTLGGIVGYSTDVNYTQEIGDATLSCSADAEIRLEDGSVESLPANTEYSFEGDSIPEIRTLDGASADVTLNVETIPLKSKRFHSLRLSPNGNITLLPLLALQKKEDDKFKTVTFLGKGIQISGLAHYNLSVPFEIPLNEEELLPIANAMTEDEFITKTITLPEAGARFGFNDASGDLLEVSVNHPLTGETRLMPRIVGGSADESVPLFPASDGGTGSLSELDEFDLVFQDLQLFDYDFGDLLSRVTVGENRLLHVVFENRPNVKVPPPFTRHLVTEGTIWFQSTSKPIDQILKNILFSRYPDRVFEGAGTLVIDDNMLIQATLDEPEQSFTNGPGHTMLFRKPTTVGRFNYDVGDTINGRDIPAVFNNQGTLRAIDGAKVYMEYWGTPDAHHLNTGKLEADGPGSMIALNIPHGINQEGSIVAADGAHTVLDGTLNPTTYPNESEPFLWRKDLLLFNNSQNSASYTADGENSLLEFLGRPLLMTGDHSFTASNLGKIQTAVFGEVFDDDPVSTGTLQVNAETGGVVEFGSVARFDGTVFVDELSRVDFNGLSSRSPGGLSIFNDGIIGFHGDSAATLAVLTPLSAATSNGNHTSSPPSGTETTQIFHNQGTVQVRDTAHVAFLQPVRSYTETGLLLEHGNWDVGGGELHLVFLAPDNSDTLNQLDDTNQTKLDALITELSGVNILRSNGTWINSTPNNDGSIQTFNLQETLLKNRGTFELLNYRNSESGDVFLNANPFSNTGNFVLEDSAFHSPEFVNEEGTTEVKAGGSLITDDGSLVISGGTVTIQPRGNINGIGSKPASSGSHTLLNFPTGTSTRISSLRTTDENGNEVIVPGSLTVLLEGAGTPGFSLDGHVELTGPGASFHSLTNATFAVTVNGSLTLSDGAKLRIKEIRMSGDGQVILGENSELFVERLIVGNSTKNLILDPSATLQAEFLDLPTDPTPEEDRLFAPTNTVTTGQFISNNYVGNGHLIGSFDLGSSTILAPSNGIPIPDVPSFGTLRLDGEVIIRAESRYELEIGEMSDGMFDRLLIHGTLEIRGSDGGFDLPWLDVTFAEGFDPQPNIALPIITVRELEQANDSGNGTQLVPGSGVIDLKHTGDFLPFHRGDILGLPSYVSPNAAGSRFAAQAPGGEYWGQSGDYDLFVFYNAGPRDNNFTLAFLDGTVTFEDGFQPEFKPPTDFVMTIDEEGFASFEWTKQEDPGLSYILWRSSDLKNLTPVEFLDSTSAADPISTKERERNFYQVQTVTP